MFIFEVVHEFTINKAIFCFVFFYKYTGYSGKSFLGKVIAGFCKSTSKINQV
jgi:hypothetical protein